MLCISAIQVICHLLGEVVYASAYYTGSIDFEYLGNKSSFDTKDPCLIYHLYLPYGQMIILKNKFCVRQRIFAQSIWSLFCINDCTSAEKWQSIWDIIFALTYISNFCQKTNYFIARQFQFYFIFALTCNMGLWFYFLIK